MKKKLVAANSKKPVTIYEDELAEGAQAVPQAIEKDKNLMEKECLYKNIENVCKKTTDLPASVVSLPEQSDKQKSCLPTNALSEEKMSDSSFAYDDECPMSVDVSMTAMSVCLSPQQSIETRSMQSLFDLDIYREDIFKYLMESQDRNRPKTYYMRRQPYVTYSMRTILVDWLVEVAEEYNLHSETLHISIYIIDRFLSLMSVVKSKLQLLGTAALFIASKYEEIYPPGAGEFAYITDKTYTKNQVLRMEHLILKVLMFDISVPTKLSFVEIICVSCNQSEKVKHLASYLCELSLLEGDPYLAHLPSLIASASIALARYCLNEEESWPADLVNFTGYTLDNLAIVIGHLNDTHAKSTSIPYQAVQDKYKLRKFQRVAEIEHKQLIIFPS